MSVDFIGVNFGSESIDIAKDFLKDQDNWNFLETQMLDTLYFRFKSYIRFIDKDMEDTAGLTNLLLNSDIDILNYMTIIPDHCYANLSLEKMMIPENIHFIGKYSFFGCARIEEMYVPDSVTVIGDSAFSYCTKLKKIRLPKKFKSTVELRQIFCTGKFFGWYDSVKTLKDNIEII